MDTLPSKSILLKLAVIHAVTSVQVKSEEYAKLTVSEAAIKRLGEAPEDQRRPLLAGRKGKGTRKIRKALNAKSNTLSYRQAAVALAKFNEYIAQYHN